MAFLSMLERVIWWLNGNSIADLINHGVCFSPIPIFPSARSGQRKACNLEVVEVFCDHYRAQINRKIDIGVQVSSSLHHFHYRYSKSIVSRMPTGIFSRHICNQRSWYFSLHAVDKYKMMSELMCLRMSKAVCVRKLHVGRIPGRVEGYLVEAQ